MNAIKNVMKENASLAKLNQHLNAFAKKRKILLIVEVKELDAHKSAELNLIAVNISVKEDAMKENVNLVLEIHID